MTFVLNTAKHQQELQANSEQINPLEDNHLTADEFKNLPEEQRKMMRKGITETLNDKFKRERGGNIEIKGNSMRNYPGNKPVVGSESSIAVTETLFRRVWRSITGWRTGIRWHTHPGGTSHSPKDFRNLATNKVPSVVITRTHVFIANPGATSEADLIVIPTNEAL